MVTVLYRQRHGYDVRIYLKDHPPAHVHVWKGESNLRMDLLTFEVSDNRGYNTREIRQIRKLVSDYQDLLLDVWHNLHEKGERPDRR